MRKSMTLTILAMTTLAFSAASSAQIGQIQDVSGRATLERGKQVMNSVPGMGIQVSDLLSTGALSSKSFVLNDGSLFRMMSGSVLQISEFSYTPAGGEDNYGKLVIDLIQGGISVVSGAIGSSAPENFLIHTPSGFINAMQGEFSVFLLNESSPAAAQAAGWDTGVYIDVTGGIVLFANDSGTHLLEPGQVVLIRNANAPPSRVAALPPGADFDVPAGAGKPDTGIPDPDQPIGRPGATPPQVPGASTPAPIPTPAPSPTAPPPTPSPQPSPTAPPPSASPQPTPSPTPQPSDPPDPSPSPDPPVSPS